MWAILLGLLPQAFTAVGNITSAISNAKIAAINAKTDQERVKAEENVRTLEAQRDVLIEDSKHSNLDIYIRTFIAIGPAAYIFKIFMYDKVLGYWTEAKTDSLDPNLWTVVTAILGFYFLSTAITTTARILKS